MTVIIQQVWKDTVCGTGRFEARQDTSGKKTGIQGYRGRGDGSIVIVKWAWWTQE